ncbi:DUF6233 domain-containing protein [Streptomyces sp. NPDC088925]|uniref:DUF6233 domain-containing protein n=1 Tax=Streptomyces sp. NPDC088925 TaxID=3365914 RepID=UPI0038106CF8
MSESEEEVKALEERLRALLFLRRVQTRDLARTERWIADAERRVAEALRRRALDQRPQPDWYVETGIGNGPPAQVHAQDCYLPGKKLRMQPILRRQALELLDGGTSACPHCRPDALLGLEG